MVKLALRFFGRDFRTFRHDRIFFFQDRPMMSRSLRSFCFKRYLWHIAATIPTGAMAERWTFKSFVIYAFFFQCSHIRFMPTGYGAGGWLSMLGKNFGLGHGVLDFAGSSVRSYGRWSFGACRSDRSWSPYGKIPVRWNTQCDAGPSYNRWPSWVASFSSSAGLDSIQAPTPRRR